MPELPEVQTIVDDLNKKIIGLKITAVWFDWPKSVTLLLSQSDGHLRVIKKPTIDLFEKQIKGLKITFIKRAGKNILIYLTENKLLLIHQKMTGHLLVGKWRIRKTRPRTIRRLTDRTSVSLREVSRSETIRTRPYEYKIESLLKGPLQEKVNDYIHLIFNLNTGLQLALSDLRKFAKVIFGEKEVIEESPDLAKIGPDPLDKKFKERDFFKIISRQKRKIKQVLMEQEIISGIGNIYSDEALFIAKVHPARIANSLNKNEMKNIFSAVREVLKKAIKLRGTSISDFRDTSGKAGGYSGVRLVYRKEGSPCGRCRMPIKRIKIGGRSAHFCPHCQKS